MGKSKISGNALTRRDIAYDLRKQGLRKGDIVELHSSLKAIGKVRGGPKTVIAAFQDVLGNTGTLMTPTFTYSSDARGEVYHPDQTSRPPIQQMVGVE